MRTCSAGRFERRYVGVGLIALICMLYAADASAQTVNCNAQQIPNCGLSQTDICGGPSCPGKCGMPLCAYQSSGSTPLVSSCFNGSKYQGSETDCVAEFNPKADPGPYGDLFQCVEFVRRFYIKTFGLGGTWGKGLANAVLFFKNPAALGLARFTNCSTTTAPRPDDIVVFAGPLTPPYTDPCPTSEDLNSTIAGHVAIVTGVTGNKVNIIEQNDSSSGVSALDLSLSPGQQYIVSRANPSVGPNNPTPYSKLKVLGWMRLQTTPVAPTVTWLASPVSTSCTGSTDASGHFWTDAAFDETGSGWTSITPPDVGSFNGVGDRFYRGHLNLSSSVSDLHLFPRCDDGCEVWINGFYLGGFGNGTCHALGCVNLPGCGIGFNQCVQPMLISAADTHAGDNIIAVHVSNGGGGSSFDMSVSQGDPGTCGDCTLEAAEQCDPTALGGLCNADITVNACVLPGLPSACTCK
jgi:CHAP domain